MNLLHHEEKENDFNEFQDGTEKFKSLNLTEQNL